MNIDVGANDFCRASRFKAAALEQGIRSVGATALGEARAALGGGTGTYGTIEIAATRDVTAKVTDALFIHRYGKGMAVYANFLLDDYIEKISNGTAASLHGIVGDLVRRFGPLEPRVEILKDDGPMHDLHTVCYRSGKTRLVAVQRHTFSYRFPRLTEEKREAVTVRLPVEGHVYEVWTRRYLGRARDVEDVFEPGARRLYVVLPYRTSGISVEAAGTAAAGADLSFRASVATDEDGPPEQHVFRLTATRPDGSEAEWFARNVVAPEGTYPGVFPVAESASLGEWTLTVRDILSGAIASHTFTVTEK